VTPIVAIIVTFMHYSLIAKLPLTPGVAFPAVSVLNELRFSLATIPETLLNAIQGLAMSRGQVMVADRMLIRLSPDSGLETSAVDMYFSTLRSETKP
jgi:hypothetical protein